MNNESKATFGERGKITIDEKHIKRFVKICSELNKLMEDIHKYNPKANYYLACDELHLMKDEHHSRKYFTPLESNSVCAKTIKYADGGDW